METKKIEVVNKTYVEIYIATDGTEFNDKEQCVAYEKSAAGVLKGRMVKFALDAPKTECDLYGGAGSDENRVYVVVPKTDDDVKTLEQLIHLKAYNKDAAAEKIAVGKVFVVTFSYDEEDMWITDLNNLVRAATAEQYEIVKKGDK